MADSRPFRVIIGGGGIAGLTLANALEKADIDYILLEARDTISPQVGASIGFFPNGGRILDQLGCFERIEQEIVPLGLYYNRYKDGSLIYAGDGIPLAQKRFVYPTTFLERETVLRILYNNLKDRSKIQLSKRIAKVDHNAKEVIVLCEDGSAISGDVLVGADGVYSKVRDELWRVAHAEEPDAIDGKDKEALMAEYNCLFGISKATDNIVDGEVHVNYANGYSTMVIGSKRKVFWFIFKRLDKIYKWPNIPRYTKHEAEQFASAYIDTAITKEVKFGDVWNNRKTYTLVATEEAQLKRWTWGRIACIGDCVHKVTPNLGAGGNQAIESAAAVANELKDMLDASEKGKPSFENVKKHLEKYQKIREERAAAIAIAANGLTRIHALKTFKDKLFAFWLLPAMGDALTDRNCDMMTGAVKLNFLPVPKRSTQGTMTFNPSQGMGKYESKLMRVLKALPFLAITATASHFMWGLALPPMLTYVGNIMESGVDSKIGHLGHLDTFESFYGLEFIDSRLRGLAACFTSFQLVDEISYWQSLTFLTDVGMLYAIFLLEGARRANLLTFASIPLLWGYNMQFLGIGVLMSVYCFLHYVQTPIENFRARDMRLTNMAYTASVLPALIAAHYIPNFGMFWPSLEPQARHSWNWIWQPFPVYVSVLQYVLSKTIMPGTMKEDRIENPNRDLPTIRWTIGTLCAISSATWWYTLYATPLSWATLFVPNLAAGQTGDESVRMFMQCDEIFSMGASFLWLLYLYGDMKAVGIMNNSWVSILLKGMVTFVALGPGSTVGLGWLYREKLLATKWHKDAFSPGKVA